MIQTASKYFFGFALFLSLCLNFAFADALVPSDPGAQVMSVVEEVRTLVRAQKDKLSEDEMDKRLREIITPAFDFRSMSRRSLATNWRKASKEEQSEFVELFSEMLARNYLKKIREGAEKGEVTLVSERKKAAKKAEVKTSVKLDGQEVEIIYRLKLKDTRWRVYDVIVEGIGLVSNYRSEFNGIVRKEGISGLLDRLRKKEEKSAAA